jgi:hypothetical protein
MIYELVSSFMLFPEKALYDPVRFVYGLFQPVQEDFIPVSFGELPGNVRTAEPVGEGLNKDGGGYAYIKAFGKTNHGDHDEIIGQFHGYGGQSGQFRSEDQGGFLIEGQGFRGKSILVRRGGNNPVTLFFQAGQTGNGIVAGAIVFKEVEPFRGAKRHVRVDLIFVAVFDDVNVLNAKTIAGTQYRAGVVGLVYVFEGNGDMSGTEPNGLLEFFKAFFSDKSLKVCDQIFGNSGVEIIGRVHGPAR